MTRQPNRAGVPALVVLAVTCGCSSAAHAEWVVSVYTGTSRTQNSALRIRQTASGSNAQFSDVEWSARPFEDAPYYGVRISYFPGRSPSLGSSLDFTHYKMYAQTNRVVAVHGTWDGSAVDERAPMNTRVQGYEVSHGVNLTALNLQYRWGAHDDTGAIPRRWYPQVGVGIAAYLPHAEGTINDVSSAGNYQLAGFGYQLFAGTEYRLTGRVGLLIEAKFDRGKLDIDLDPATRAETTTRTLHALAGVSLHF